jgi:acyl-CoA synthetase (AMP-forming)/AMP-acid ligase II
MTAPAAGEGPTLMKSSLPQDFTRLTDMVTVHARTRPNAPAITFEGQVISFAELDARANRVAAALAACGIGFGDRVAFLDKNTPAYFEVLFGAAKLGAVLCAINFRLSAEEAAYIVNDAEAKVFFVGGEFAELAERIQADGVQVHTVLIDAGQGPQHYEHWLAAHPADPPPPLDGAGGDDVAVQFYSSGTTGRPKGVMLTDAACLASLRSFGGVVGLDEHSRSLVALPVYHLAGSFWGLLSLYEGTPSVLLRETDAAEIVATIEAHGITHTVMVPAVILNVVDLPDVGSVDFSTLQMVVYGASPISEDVLRRAIRVLQCGFFQGYGLTESGGACVWLLPSDHDPDGPNRHRLRSAGMPVPGVDVLVVAPDTGAPVAVGEVGELLVRGSQMMLGYWRMPQATEETLRADGYLRTGDVGYFDDDGYVYIHDRMKDVIISGGENIYPAEVENALMAHPGIADVAVIGVPDEKWGEVGMAMVVAGQAGLTSEEVIAYARSRLAHYKCPTRVTFLEELPRNPSGKILKRELREPFWAGQGRRVN